MFRYTVPRPHNIRQTLLRGLRRRCPRCGEGELFRRWLEIHERCPHCDLVYQPDYGDTWFFLIITDRIPLLFGIAVVYFGFTMETWLAPVGFFFAMAVPLIATVRQRQGMAIALDYLVREWTGQASGLGPQA
ncbi:MAG TPA: DUF983 domain-containing protein [Thermoanaerobaculia bacterium]|nr:DUF983 domain-containing protein [Thermoanaerobaculia bacterium]